MSDFWKMRSGRHETPYDWWWTLRLRELDREIMENYKAGCYSKDEGKSRLYLLYQLNEEDFNSSNCPADMLCQEIKKTSKTLVDLRIKFLDRERKKQDKNE